MYVTRQLFLHNIHYTSKHIMEKDMCLLEILLATLGLFRFLPEHIHI